MKNYVSLLLLASCILAGCRKEVALPTVDYFITTTPSETYRRLSFAFNGTRAIRDSRDFPGSSATISVYIDPTVLNLSIGEPRDTVFLGSSTIEPGLLRGFDFWFSDYRVETEDRILQLPDGTLPKLPVVNKDILIEAGRNKKITFVIDVDASVVQSPDGADKFVARIFVVED